MILSSALNFEETEKENRGEEEEKISANLKTQKRRGGEQWTARVDD